MEYYEKIKDWFISTKIHEQVGEVDYIGLFTNPWFMVPFVLLICYLLFKQKWKDIIIITIFVGVWWVSGTAYIDTLLVNGEVQINKVLPVVFGGAVILGFVIYLIFGRSD